MRVLLVGDVHGNTTWMVEHVLRKRARRERISLVLQVGDFGIWPGECGQRYLNAIDRTLGEICERARNWHAGAATRWQ